MWWLVAIALLVAFVASADAARRTHFFDTISSAEGLAQNSVLAFARDQRGFVWIATQGGLHRFDGMNFDRFEYDALNDASLPDNLITALAIDATGLLWVGTHSRFLASLDPQTGQVVRHRGRLPADADALRDRVVSIQPAADGGIWVGTAMGVEHYDPVNGARRPIVLIDTQTPASRSHTNDLELDRHGRLWVASEQGLFRIDPKGHQARRIGPPLSAFAVHRDASGQLWASTQDGLFRVDTDPVDDAAYGAAIDDGDAGALHAVVPAAASVALDNIWRITTDDRQRLWLAMIGGGVLRYDPAVGDVLRFEHDFNIPDSIPEGEVLSLMVDPSNLLWIGTQSRGIATTRADGDRFPLLFDPLRERGNNNIRAVLEADDGVLWVGSDVNGLRRIDPVTGAFENHIDAVLAVLPQPASPRGVRIHGLARGDNGHFWISSDHGLFDYDPVGRRAELVSEPAVRSGLLPDNQFRFVRRAADGNSLWVGTGASGLVRYWPATREWRRYPHDPADPQSIAGGMTTTLFEEPGGRVWVGTLNGLNLLDPASGRNRRIQHASDDPASLSGDVVRAVLQATDGRIWVATHDGLNELLDGGTADPRIDAQAIDRPLRFRRYGTADGLPSSIVYGVQEDRQGALWIATNFGLARMRPGSNEIRQFGVRDGLQSLEFHGGADLALSDGRLAFGGIHGLNVFDPARISDSHFAPPVVVTRVRVGDEPERPRDLAPLTRLDVPRDARLLRLRFAALDYTAPGYNRFQYRLEGFDPDWVDAGTTPEATYTNLDAGHYQLHVRATNHDGVWSGNELSLPLAVIPPWWASPMARLLYLLATLGACVAMAVTWRHRRASERRLLRTLQQREERLTLALWGSGDEFWDWNVQSNTIQRVGADQLLGPHAEQRLSTDDWRARALHPDDLQRVQAKMQAHIAGKTDFFESEHRIRNVQGDWMWVRSRGKVVERDGSGNPLRIAGTARDITRSRLAEGERRVALEVLRSMGEAVGVIDLAFCFVAVNPAFSRITGYSENEVRGQLSSMLDSDQHSAEFYARLRETVERHGHWKGEMWQRRKDGEEFLGWIELSEVCDALGARTHFVAVVTDITGKKRAEQELQYLANYDTLTGLANRSLLAERLGRAVIRARRQHTRVAVLFLDLDRFKDINDSLGHSAGDRILKSAAARLLATVRETDTVARLGGDEFTVILEDLSDPAAAETMAAAIVAAFAEPMDDDGRSETVVSPSIGIALFPDHGAVPTDLLKFADTAMYQAKARGRNTWQVYTEAMDAETRRRASVIAALRRALERGEFRLVYQPKMSLHTGRITGVEALLRWRSAELGEMLPADFIPLAEETGLILPIGEWVLREAAQTLAAWLKEGASDVVMAVNVSMLQFLRARLAEQVAEVVADTGIPPALLELEVTESMVMANAEQAIRVMSDLKRIGLSLAIDDFGTGYSSLVYLKRLPIDTLKIDKEFVGDLTTDPDDEAITTTVITMAHSLGLNVVAEGVETDEQLIYLREHGCDEIQGFRLARPLDAPTCLQFMRDFARDGMGARMGNWEPGSAGVKRTHSGAPKRSAGPVLANTRDEQG